MASAEHERITGVWGQSPQRGPGTEPLVRGRGVHGNGEDWDPMGPMGFPWEWE